MGWIMRERDALEAIAKGRIVDEVDDHVPSRVVGVLKAYAWCGAHNVLGHVRYDGAREIWWFDARNYVLRDYAPQHWPKDLFSQSDAPREAA